MRLVVVRPAGAAPTGCALTTGQLPDVGVAGRRMEPHPNGLNFVSAWSAIGSRHIRVTSLAGRVLFGLAIILAWEASFDAAPESLRRACFADQVMKEFLQLPGDGLSARICERRGGKELPAGGQFGFAALARKVSFTARPQCLRSGARLADQVVEE
jgi:hypothetical protein